MKSPHRSATRLFPAILGAAFLLFMLATTTQADSLNPAHIGLQLYSLRNQLTSDVPGTLDVVKSWGITNVELAGTYNLTAEQFKAQLDAHGLHAFSGHFPFDRFRNDPE